MFASLDNKPTVNGDTRSDRKGHTEKEDVFQSSAVPVSKDIHQEDNVGNDGSNDENGKDHWLKT